MKFKFGEIIYDPSNPICIQLLGKVVIGSNIGKDINKNPETCLIGTLSEIFNVNSDKPFIIETKDGTKVQVSFIREILKLSE